MRFVCELDGQEQVVEADDPEQAAHRAARAAGLAPGRYRVSVAEANEADLPLIAGDDHWITVSGDSDAAG